MLPPVNELLEKSISRRFSAFTISAPIASALIFILPISTSSFTHYRRGSRSLMRGRGRQLQKRADLFAHDQSFSRSHFALYSGRRQRQRDRLRDLFARSGHF